MEERLDVGVVGDLAWSVHALRDPQIGQTLLEYSGSVLYAPVGMEDQALPWAPIAHRSIQGTQGKPHVLALAKAPAEHPAAVAVHDHRQVTVDRADLEISNVAYPLGFWGWALGTFLLRANRVDEALVETRTASRRDSTLYLARVLEAAALDRLGHLDDARTALAVARQLLEQLTLSEVTLTHGRHVGERMALLWDPVARR